MELSATAVQSPIGSNTFESFAYAPERAGHINFGAIHGADVDVAFMGSILESLL